MTSAPDFDTTTAHRYFAAHCFNQSWELIKKTDRTADEDEQLIARGHASLWHWTERADCTDQNLAIGYWLLARIYCVTKRAEPAQRYAEHCLSFSERESVNMGSEPTIPERCVLVHHVDCVEIPGISTGFVK